MHIDAPPQRPVDLDKELAASRYDPATKQHHYSIERLDRRWTVSVPSDDLDQYGPAIDDESKRRRRDHVANLLSIAMQGKGDGE